MVKFLNTFYLLFCRKKQAKGDGCVNLFKLLNFRIFFYYIFYILVLYKRTEVWRMQTVEIAMLNTAQEQQKSVAQD